MQELNIQWHPGFVAAMNLELMQNREDLIFESEYNLNTKPLEIDLLVVKKRADILIDNEIGRLFRGHNILEYKSPEDQLDIDVFYKIGSYAGLYKSYGRSSDAIKADDITVSLLRQNRPMALFRYFAEHHFAITNPHPGIYYIRNKVLFPTQIIVTGELDKSAHIWLGALSNQMKKQEMAGLLETVDHLNEKWERQMADSVLEVSVRANQQLVEELKGENRMCKALMEIMEPEITEACNAARREGLSEGRREGLIRGTINTLRDIGRREDEIKSTLMSKFELSESEAEAYL